MDEQLTSTVRALSRQSLEDLTICAMMEVQSARRERLQNDQFVTVVTWFLFGVLVAVSGFLIGAAIR